MKLFTISSIIFLFSCQLFAMVQGVPNLSQLSSSGELIAIAKVNSVSSASGSDAGAVLAPTSVTVNLQLQKVIKGSLAPNSLIAVRWSQSGQLDSNPLAIGDLGLWFLTTNADGSWSPLSFVSAPRMVDDIRIPLNSLIIATPLVGVRSASNEEHVLLEVLNAALTDQGNRYTYLYWGAYDDLSPRAMESFYRELSSQPPASRQALGVAGLIRLGYADGLLVFEREFARFTPNIGNLTFSIAAHFRNTDDVSISALGRLVEPKYPLAVRKAAAQSLAFVHNERTLPLLAALLDSGEPTLELHGAAGLALFANGVSPIGKGASANFSPSGAPSPFRSEETLQKFTMDPKRFDQQRDSYKQFWRNWWNANRGSIVSPN